MAGRHTPLPPPKALTWNRSKVCGVYFIRNGR
jgi:hypothetical protein